MKTRKICRVDIPLDFTSEASNENTALIHRRKLSDAFPFKRSEYLNIMLNLIWGLFFTFDKQSTEKAISAQISDILLKVFQAWGYELVIMVALMV